MIYTDIEQRSAEWLQMRCGCVTASRLGDVMAKLKRSKNEAADRAAYRKELVCERLTGNTADHYVSPYMEHGEAQEPFARAAYEISTGFDVREVGLALHDSIKWFAASPDSLVGEDGLLEIKCLASHNHLDIILSGTIPDEYIPQLLGELSCTGRKWVDFVSFDPRLPKHLQLFIKRYHRDETLIAAAELEVKDFLAEVAALMTRLDTEDLTAILKASLEAACTAQ